MPAIISLAIQTGQVSHRRGAPPGRFHYVPELPVRNVSGKVPHDPKGFLTRAERLWVTRSVLPKGTTPLPIDVSLRDWLPARTANDTYRVGWGDRNGMDVWQTARWLGVDESSEIMVGYYLDDATQVIRVREPVARPLSPVLTVWIPNGSRWQQIGEILCIENAWRFRAFATSVDFSARSAVENIFRHPVAARAAMTRWGRENRRCAVCYRPITAPTSVRNGMSRACLQRAFHHYPNNDDW